MLATLNVADVPRVTVLADRLGGDRPGQPDAFTVENGGVAGGVAGAVGYRDGELRVVIRYDFRRSGVAR